MRVRKLSDYKLAMYGTYPGSRAYRLGVITYYDCEPNKAELENENFQWLDQIKPPKQTKLYTDFLKQPPTI